REVVVAVLDEERAGLVEDGAAERGAVGAPPAGERFVGRGRVCGHQGERWNGRPQQRALRALGAEYIPRIPLTPAPPRFSPAPMPDPSGLPFEAVSDLPPVARRFGHYVTFDTQSDPTSETFPSTEKQKAL